MCHSNLVDESGREKRGCDVTPLCADEKPLLKTKKNGWRLGMGGGSQAGSVKV